MFSFTYKEYNTLHTRGAHLRTVLSVSRVFRTIIPFESKPAAGKLGPISIRRIPRDGK